MSRPTKRLRIAIDGPAGAGKSTVARALARRLGYLLVDTGAMYRGVALAATRAGVRLDRDEELGALATTLCDERRLSLTPGTGDGVTVWLDGDDVSQAIRTPEISLAASQVSAAPSVRQALLSMQRQAGESGGVVLEGRDIGTVVFPDADIKFFLTADAGIRAARRKEELARKGQSVSYESTLADVNERDRADSERAVAPLRRADDAIVMDSTSRTIDDVVSEMLGLIEQRTGVLPAETAGA